MLGIARVALAALVACGLSAGAAAAANAPSPGTANVHFDGKVRLDRTVAVKNCDAQPAGHSLMSGYSMDLRGDDFVESGGIHVAAYAGDRTYQVPVHVHSFAEDPLQLSFHKSGTFPRGSTLEQVKGSSLTVATSEHGKRGVATFKAWKLLYPDGATVSGTLTWRCP